jgi:hypothetical protein
VAGYSALQFSMAGCELAGLLQNEDPCISFIVKLAADMSDTACAACSAQPVTAACSVLLAAIHGA